MKKGLCEIKNVHITEILVKYCEILVPAWKQKIELLKYFWASVRSFVWFLVSSWAEYYCEC